MLNQYERAKFLGTSLADFGDGRMNIPENANGVPDILDEARWELEFLLKMQVPAGQPLAGMAHHKMHDQNWTGIPTRPDQDSQPRVLRPPSTAATLNLAATAAQCARIWQTIDTTFSNKCLTAAQTAWTAAQANPSRLAPDSDGTGGGAYSDNNVQDEFYWAAAELYITTGNSTYLNFLTGSPHYKSVPAAAAGGTSTTMTWGSTQALGSLSLAVVPNNLPASEITSIRNNVVSAANIYLNKINSQGYRMPFNGGVSGSYSWGSSHEVVNNGIVLALAYDFTGSAQYLNGAAEAMNYLLGRNALSKSYVSGYGENPLQNPHHRFWAFQANSSFPRPPAGALSGGPNSSLQDPYAAANLAGCAPQKCYADHIDSYSTNEVTINWNAPLAWLAAFLDEKAGASPTPTPTFTATPCPSLTITGRITSVINGQNIAGATVIADTVMSHPFAATTGADGTYSLGVPGTSNYACSITGLRAWATGYEERTLAVSSAELFAQPQRNFALNPITTITPTFTPTPTQPGSNNTGWVSPSTQASQSGGDGNGFQTSPTNAFADGGGVATDTNSGNGSSTSCTSTAKDRHAYFNYPLSIPSGSTITGIEVRTDARADSSSGAPHFCVEISWNNGANWTAMKTGPNLTTTERSDVLGSANDNWGRTWNTSELTNASFRVRIVSVSSSTSRDFFLDWLPVRVWYSGGGATNTPTNTPTVTATPSRTNTPTNTPTGVTNTPTRTLTPTFTPTVGPTTLRLQYRAADTNAGDNQIKPHFNIINPGTSLVPLSELKIRYWFTREGTAGQSFWCDWAMVTGSCSNVTGTFVQVNPARTGADFYLEVGFNPAAGSIPAGGQSGEIQTRISKSDWSNYTETGDYSFDPTKTAFADWTHVTLYRNGVLVWGVEP